MKRLAWRNLKLPVPGLARRQSINAGGTFLTAQNQQDRRQFHCSPIRPKVIPYLLADIGEGITECQIVNWSVKPGDRVEQFDPICEVQSDKASVEVTSRFEGTIKSLHYETDDMAVVGKPLLDIDVDDVEGEQATLSPSSRDPESHEAETLNSEKTEIILSDEMQKRSGPEPQVSEIITLPAKDHTTSPSPIDFSKSTTNAAHVTPGVRHMLKKLKLDVADVKGTGRNGRVLKEDIQRHLSASSSQSTPPSITPAISLPPHSPDDKIVPLSPIENQMFKIMTQSLTIPHFLYTHSIDFTGANRLRKKFNSRSLEATSAAPKLTPLPFIMKALSQVFVQFPKLNSHLDSTTPEKPQLHIKGAHNFGIAVDTPNGLLVPIVKNVQNLSVTEIAAEINRLSGLAKDGNLGVNDFKGATFSISNIGSIGGGIVSPIIVAPSTGILGVGRLNEVPVFSTGERGTREIVAKEVMMLSWSADHRILDGATVAKCAEALRDLLENIDVLSVTLK